MRFSRSDYYESVNEEVYNSCKENLSKQSYPTNIQDFLANRFNNSNKNGIEERINDFKNRTGLAKYLNEVNSEINNKKIAEDRPESLLDIPKVKESIDMALQSNQFNRTIDLLNKLQYAINEDKTIPEDLKSVTMDAKLIDYIKYNIKNQNEDIDYNHLLKMKDVQNLNADQRNSTYFNFDSKENYGTT